MELNVDLHAHSGYAGGTMSLAKTPQNKEKNALASSSALTTPTTSTTAPLPASESGATVAIELGDVAPTVE